VQNSLRIVSQIPGTRSATELGTSFKDVEFRGFEPPAKTRANYEIDANPRIFVMGPP